MLTHTTIRRLSVLVAAMSVMLFVISGVRIGSGAASSAEQVAADVLYQRPAPATSTFSQFEVVFTGLAGALNDFIPGTNNPFTLSGTIPSLGEASLTMAVVKHADGSITFNEANCTNGSGWCLKLETSEKWIVRPGTSLGVGPDPEIKGAKYIGDGVLYEGEGPPLRVRRQRNR